MSEWQPIETAPRDGKVVLLGWAGDFMPEIAHFNSEYGWVNEYSDSVHAPPTHWMPLPAPPELDAVVVTEISPDADGTFIGEAWPVESVSREELAKRYPPKQA